MIQRNIKKVTELALTSSASPALLLLLESISLLLTCISICVREVLAPVM